MVRKRIHVIINPAAGVDEPILNTLNDVFRRYEVEWDVSLTHKSGDAARLARLAVERGVDVVAAYGGDGTIMEVANGLAGGLTPLGLLPGGTGNGLAKELKIPIQLSEAAKVVCQSTKVRRVDLALVNGRYSTLHTYIGLDKTQQAPRESKDRLGMLAYIFSILKIIKEPHIATYKINIDGVQSEVEGIMCLITNAIGLGLQWASTAHIRLDDGKLDVIIFKKDMLSLAGELLQEWRHPGQVFHAGQGSKITIEADPVQPVWVDGEWIRDTPVTAVIAPQVLPVIVPE